jgi:succinyl-diaminopimelate desuccinylase
VIPAKDSQFKPKIVGNKLYGAGSMDMKANAACAIYAFKELAKTVNYSIGLQLVTDEEIGGENGTGYQVEKVVLATEPTNFNIVYKAKGVCQIKITAKGLTAHGAYPWRGDNAIEKMNSYILSLKKVLVNPKKETWVTTVNVSKIETTNNSFNKIPDDCTVWLDIRHIAEDSKTILSRVKKTLPRDFSLELVSFCSAVYTPEKNQNILLLEKITKEVIKNKVILRGANGTSDVAHFAEVGNLGIEFGPIGDGIGSDEEWVDIPSLENYFKIIKKFILLTV